MAKKGKTDPTPTEAQVEQYEMLYPILTNLLVETKELSKKKPDNPLNKLKVQMVNKILLQVKDVLANDPALQFLDMLDDETLPSNSDAVFIIAQYEAAMEQFRSKHYYQDKNTYKMRWHTK
ncbi:MAG: hypothetical protein FVQ85_19940 [Planctomycetes bacterium]|nr:hypothetical protein [Planctomycetota bacterium]